MQSASCVCEECESNDLRVVLQVISKSWTATQPASELWAAWVNNQTASRV